MILSKAWQSEVWFKLQAKKCKRCLYSFVKDVCISYHISYNASAYADFQTNTYTSTNIQAPGVYSNIKLGGTAVADFEAAISTGQFQLGFDIPSATSFKAFTSNLNKLTVYYKAVPRVELDLCIGEAPGVLDTLKPATGGSGSYTYIWQQSSNGNSWTTVSGKSDSSLYDASFTHLNTTIYRRITIDNACADTVISTHIAVNIPDSLQLSAYIDNIRCNGSTNGFIFPYISGGVAPYTYLWSNAETTDYLSGLSAGIYTVTVTDDMGCSIIDSLVVTEPAVLVASVLVDNNKSCGASDAAVTASATGGTSPYSYLWSNSATTASITGLAVGTYTVTLTDNYNCTATSNVTITEPAPIANPVINEGDTTYLCDSNGFTVSTNPISGYSYEWLTISEEWQKLGNSFGGTNSEYQSLVFNEDTAYVVFRDNANNGQSVVYKYNGNAWVQVGTSFGGPANFQNIKFISGIPYVSFQDGGNSYKSSVYKYNGSAWVQVGATFGGANYSRYQSLSFNGDTAYVAFQDATNNGKSTVYKYNSSAWVQVGTSFGGSYSHSQVINFNAGIPYVAFSDGANNYSSTMYKYNGSAWVQVGTSFGGSHSAYQSLSFNGDTAYVAFSDGANSNKNSIYKYDGSTWVQVGTSFGGEYSRYPNLSFKTGVPYVAFNDGADFNKSTVYKYNGSAWVKVGSALGGNNSDYSSLSINEGIPYVAFKDSDNSNKSSVYKLVTNLNVISSADTAQINSPGNYILKATSADGCVAYNTILVLQNPEIILSATVDSNATCNGLNNGGLTASATGGTPPYSYLWSNSATTASITGLAAGTYTLTLTDSKGCTATSSSAITEPSALLAVSSIDSNVICNGFSNGGASANATGGITPYSYLWSNSATTASITGLAGATYTVTVTENNGCTARATSTIIEPSALAVSPSVTSDYNGEDISCNGANNGEVTATTTGGTAPYTYAWSTADTTAHISGLSAASYTVSVTDKNGCLVVDSVKVSEPDSFLIGASTLQNISCYGANDGQFQLIGTGGTQPYFMDAGGFNFAFDGDSIFSGLEAVPGLPIIVQDANGCIDTAIVNISEPTELLVISVVDSNITCKGLSNGGATASASGGTAAYTYLWSNGATSTSIIGVVAGTYTVSVTDNNGCMATSTATITEPDSLLFSATTLQNISCFGAADGQFQLIGTGGTQPYLINAGGFPLAFDGDSIFSNANAVSSISLTLLDANGCMDTAIVSITEPSQLLVTSAVDSNVTCNGASNGGATASASGGTAPYTYLWSNGATTASITGVAANTYTVSVTDNNGCTATSSSTIIEPTALVASAVVDSNVTCNGASNGGATASASGGTAPYAFLWSNGTTTASISGLRASTYTLTITDNNGCTATSTATITEPVLITGAVSFTVCDSYTVPSGNATYNFSGIYKDTIPSSGVCDSVITINLTVNYSSSGVLFDRIEACNSYTWTNGITYTASNNSATDTFPNIAGCDSVMLLHLTINYSQTSTDVQTACDSYTWTNGITYTASNNSATDTFNTAAGCDSVVTLNLTIYNSASSTDVQTACDSYTWTNGVTYTASNTSATDTFNTIAGCDSVVTLNLTINNSTSSTDVQVACDSYTWIDGNTYTVSNNSATHTLPNAVGCDSVVTLDLTVNSTTFSSDIVRTCGTSYTWVNGITYTSSNTTAKDTFTNAAGCDSIVSLSLTLLSSSLSVDAIVACNSYTWTNGITYTESNNTALDTFTNVVGCDSIVSLSLIVNRADTLVGIDGLSLESYARNATYQWIACGSGVAIDGATAQNFTPSANGYYAVVVTENGCTTTSKCYAITTVAIQETLMANDIKAYPNPTNGTVTIDFGSNTDKLDVRINNVIGQLIYSKNAVESNQLTLSIAEAKAGIYFISINNEAGASKVIKLIKY